MADQLRLEQWWERLTPREQRSLAYLRTGDVLPLALYPLLYGFIEAHISNMDAPGRSSLEVPPELGDFLAAKRDQARDPAKSCCESVK